MVNGYTAPMPTTKKRQLLSTTYNLHIIFMFDRSKLCEKVVIRSEMRNATAAQHLKQIIVLNCMLCFDLSHSHPFSSILTHWRYNAFPQMPHSGGVIRHLLTIYWREWAITTGKEVPGFIETQLACSITHFGTLHCYLLRAFICPQMHGI